MSDYGYLQHGAQPGPFRTERVTVRHTMPEVKPATIYYEAGLPATLVPCAFIGWAKTPGHELTGCFNAVVRLKRAAPGYQKGEILHVPARAVVIKAGRRNYHQLVKAAPLPPVDPATVMQSRI